MGLVVLVRGLFRFNEVTLWLRSSLLLLTQSFVSDSAET